MPIPGQVLMPHKQSRVGRYSVHTFQIQDTGSYLPIYKPSLNQIKASAWSVSSAGEKSHLPHTLDECAAHRLQTQRTRHALDRRVNVAR